MVTGHFHRLLKRTGKDPPNRVAFCFVLLCHFPRFVAWARKPQPPLVTWAKYLVSNTISVHSFIDSMALLCGLSAWEVPNLAQEWRQEYLWGYVLPDPSFYFSLIQLWRFRDGEKDVLNRTSSLHLLHFMIIPFCRNDLYERLIHVQGSLYSWLNWSHH